MIQKYLSEFYSYRAMLVGVGRVVADPKTPLELQIQAHILTGNWAFFKGKYALALDEYLQAWGMLPTLVHPGFSDKVVWVNDAALLGVDLTKSLTVASGQLLKWRAVAGPAVRITTPGPPPPELVALSEPFTGPTDPAADHLDRAVDLVQIGDLEQAEVEAGLAIQLGVDDLLQANAHAVLGAIETRRNNLGGAGEYLGIAAELFGKTQQPQGLAAMLHNLGVVQALSGEVAGGSGSFAAAAINAPLNLSSQVVRTLNVGLDSVIQPMGQAGLPLMISNTSASWSTVAHTAASPPKSQTIVVAGDKGIPIDLSGDAAGAIEKNLLQSRVAATALADLDHRLWDLIQFVTYLAHVQGFVLPLALGDTYAALGDYAKAGTYYIAVRDYPYLNQAIERPMVWCKLAESFLYQGDRLYRDRDEVGARAQYENILQIVPGGFNLSGPLYSGGFADLVAETLAFLQDPAPLEFPSMDYGRKHILMSARASLNQILNGINYLGFPDDIVPIHPWRYLQNLARYFANQAIQAERSYVTFRDRSQQEEFTRLTLEQAVDAQAGALAVEQRKVDAAVAQQQVAQLSASLANTRLDDAKAQKDDYANLSEQTGYIDEITAFTNAGDRDVTLSEDWAATLGIEEQKVKLPTPFGVGETELTLNTFKAPYLVQLLTRKRNKLTRDYELKNMQRKIDELQGELDIAKAQSIVADRMLDVANAQRDLAQLRRDQAQAQLQFFDAKEFTPELWDKLAQAQRQISRRYLDWAISAAFLMERAFEVEYDTVMRRIRFDYTRSDLNGLMGGDYLLADIDQFSFDRLIETEKKLPVKVVISLADAYPFQFRQQFQQTGRMDFQTQLEDFDRWHPGAHLRKLRRVEVIVEGLLGPNGIQGRLTNSGISVDRDRNGDKRVRPQQSETMLLSRFDLRGDGFVFTSTEEQVLAVFENSGVASGWILVFPPDSNDVDYTSITNVHLLLYFDAYYNERVANVVRAELAATALYEYSLGVGLRFQFPDQFFALQTTGAVTFTLDPTYLPFDHTAAIIRSAHLVVETTPGVGAGGLILQFTNAAGTVNVSLTTDARGAVSTDDGGSPFNAVRGLPLLDTWTITIDKAANAAAFAAGFDWDKVKNIFWFTEYTYTPRGRPIARDDFNTDPMATFDVVDDARATDNAPSQWAYNAAAHRVEQTSGVQGPAGVNTMNADPDKPGTYLVKQASAQWPTLADLVLQCGLDSETANGIGVVFRYQDADNFYFFLMDSARSYRRVGKKVGGVFHELDTPAVNLATGFEVGRDYALTLAMVGDAVKVYLDEVEILSGRDRTLALPGRVGFYAWGNPAARFLRLSAQPV
jgi:hypothetical protein